MTWYDKNKIISTSNSYDVAQALGMKLRKSGNKYFISCPGHLSRMGKIDAHDTNAYLTKHGYYCAACGCAVNNIDMVMEVRNYSFFEALDFVADLYGGKDLFIDETKNDNIKIKKNGKDINFKKIRTLTWDEQFLLNLNPKYENWLYPIQCYNYKPQEETVKKTFFKNGNEINEWIVSESKPVNFTLSFLAQKDYPMYISLVVRKCFEQLDNIDSVITELQKPEEEGEEYAVSLNYILRQKRKKIWDIVNNYSEEINKITAI